MILEIYDEWHWALINLMSEMPYCGRPRKPCPLTSLYGSNGSSSRIGGIDILIRDHQVTGSDLKASSSSLR